METAKTHTEVRDARIDNIRRSTRQTRKANWYDSFKGPWQYHRVLDIPDIVKERFEDESYEDYKQRRLANKRTIKLLMKRGYRNFTARILRERDGHLVNIGTGTFWKKDYE